MATGMIAPTVPEANACLAGIARLVAGIVNRVHLTPEEGPHSYRLLPQVSASDLWRTLPRLARQLARSIDAGHIADPGVCSDRLRAIATMIERGASVADIRYVIGDATAPIRGVAPAIIAHVCNDAGGWGAGFVLAISRKWPEPEAAYRSLATYELGSVDFVSVSQGIEVANMIAQRGFGIHDGEIPLSYEALAECLTLVARRAADIGAVVHMPRIGCGLAGGKWDQVEPIIARKLSAFGVPAVVYDLA